MTAGQDLQAASLPGASSTRKAAGSPGDASPTKRQQANHVPQQAAVAPPPPPVPQQAELEERRRELAEVYAAYAALTQQLEHGAGGSTLSPPPPPPDRHFLRLLQAGTGERVPPACPPALPTKSVGGLCPLSS